jgi:hypothetical protein
MFRKVRKTQHQNPEFGPKPADILKKRPANKYISIQGEVKLRNAPFLFYFGGKLLSFIVF